MADILVRPPINRDDPTVVLPRIDHRLPGMHLVAAVGIGLIGYSYLAALWPVRHGWTPASVLAVREWLNFPLGIGTDFGVLGVGLLLAAAGFRATEQVVNRHSGRLTGVALVGGYLPYALACTISWLLVLGKAEPLTVPRHLGSPDVPANLLLVNRMTGDGALLALGWAVAAAACFAVLLACTGVLLQRRRAWLPQLGLAAQLAVVAAISATAAGVGGWYHELGLLVTYCVFPLVGQLVWLARAGRFSGWAAAPAGLGCFAVLVHADRGYPELGGWWTPLTLLYVLLIVLLAVARGGRADRGRVARWLGSRAYAAALLVCAIGYPLLGALAAVDVPFGVALPLACAVTLLLADIVYRLTAAAVR